MTGTTSSRWPPELRFYLDEGLPAQTAEALRAVGYPILDCFTEGMVGAKDPDLIAWMGQHGLIWITKDADSKRAHIGDIRRHGVSVVWVRGIDRGDARIDGHLLHTILTAKLLRIANVVSTARGAVHHEVYTRGDPDMPTVVLHRLDLDRIEANRLLRRARLRG